MNFAMLTKLARFQKHTKSSDPGKGKGFLANMRKQRSQIVRETRQGIEGA